MDGQGTTSPLDLVRMRHLSNERLPVPSKHIGQLLDLVEGIRKETRFEALEEAARAFENLPHASFNAAVAAEMVRELIERE
ncbi:hypothetical protein [Roseibium sp. RKSG952]|uniref:hypothetical protein n=1 Tax=Roseibium sp. RKSG952 TaxID=2529384 RepID=UPI0012BD124C|nr:hypothetical protein [Roseibium sp. RKSG952]MTH96537.1 hypothetical protein [Roseibium sp. RKSG952]